ncbi:ABC transporter ATP-binding protein [Microbacterium sp.]|jgi:ABC-2 type transport system ATP-binding protein|uniref:ABC transporter ATP-binding protein n=1 Tax=Microbacterium sp. TaxID=51671 RepID=UPI002BC41D86|nr:ABC transporter ATP-binding protein [Microbacterium sp.]HWL77530.1 ABC transporter ATP-binding protein [Microbacterium sp.]
MTTPTVDVQQLRKAFGPTEVLHDVTFTVHEGEVFGILGPNGAGKTTTIECIVGAQRPTGGSVRVLSRTPHLDRGALRQLVGYQLQASVLPNALRVREVLEVFARLYRTPRDVSELMEETGLTSLARRFVGTLSGGQRQRLSTALALVGSPRVVVLDELTTGLDPQARLAMWELVERVRAGGITVLLVTHALDEVERLCDRVTVVLDGRTIFTGTPQEMRRLAASGSDERGSLQDAYVQLIERRGAVAEMGRK